MDTTKLVADEKVSVRDVSGVEQGKNMLQRYGHEMCRNPDLDGPATLIFEKQPTDEHPVPAVEVTLVGRPGQPEIKRKHYVIYSKLPGFDKTYQLKRLAETYNVHFVNNPANWKNVPRCAQFLVLYRHHSKLSFKQLKALTDILPSKMLLSNSFRPRNDVQVVMLCDRSPYEIYGKWDAVLGRRVMDKLQMDKFHDRFEVFCLDGSANEDRVRGSTSDMWSKSQFRDECKSIVDEIYKSLTDGQPVERKVTEMIRLVDMIVHLCRQRETKKTCIIYVRVATVLTELDKGRFWPPLVKMFNVCYKGHAIKRKGRALVSARDRLIRQASIEEKTFDAMRREELTAYIAHRPFSAYDLFRFYTSSPRYIDFDCDDKERVFRKCLSVHDAIVDDDYLYRTLVFEKVWNIARENDSSAKKRKLVSPN